jgi:hypothetical protein
MNAENSSSVLAAHQNNQCIRRMDGKTTSSSFPSFSNMKDDD